MTTKTLRVTCDPENRLLRIPVDQLNEIQGELKEMSVEDYGKFKTLVLEDGINFSFHVWKELTKVHSESEAKRIAALKNGVYDGVTVVKWWIIDGHGRKKMFLKMRTEGYEVPSIPCVEIEAVSFDDAKRRVLSASSTFHKVTNEGMYEFLNDAKLSPDVLEKFSISNFDLKLFNDEFFKESKTLEKDGAIELDRNSFTVFNTECPKCGFSFNEKK